MATMKQFVLHTILTVDENHRIEVASDTKDANFRNRFFPAYRKGNVWAKYMRNGNIVAYFDETTARRHIAVSLSRR